jgi:hypothetical protein
MACGTNRNFGFILKLLRRSFMKKIICVVLMLSAAAYGIFAQSAAQSGVIRELTGEVELKPAGTTAFVAARAGDEVAPNTIVSTGFKSTAVIAVGSSVITVRPLTRLSLAEIQSSSGTETTNDSLQTGRVRVDVNPPAGTKADFTVQGPTATASVRGTSFEFDTVNLAVSEGRVAFSGASGLVTMVNAGGANFVGTDKEPANATGVEASLLPPAPVGTPADETMTRPSPPSFGEQGFYLWY